MLKRISVLLALLGLLCSAVAAENKSEAVSRMRRELAAKIIRGSWFRAGDWRQSAALLGENGVFSDYAAQEKKIRTENLTQKQFDYYEPQSSILKLTSGAFARLWQISEALRNNAVPEGDRDALRAKLYRGAVNYGDLEVNRISTHTGRWTDSPFFIPTAAINIYFANLADMERAEKGEKVSPELAAAAKMLPQVAFESWKQPLRKDATDKNIISVERFRKNTFYVGGNALSYRPLLETALLMRSVPMVDVVAEVAARSMGAVNQNNYEASFWTEGITSDGAGWGHGRQALVWGYPTDGLSGALNVLRTLRGSPWGQALPRPALDAFLSFVRGSSFYYYRGHVNALVSRDNTRQADLKAHVARTRYLSMLMLELYGSNFTAAEQSELRQFIAEANQMKIKMTDQPSGLYSGIRHFFNNDDIICKNDGYYMMCNMSSFRTDGLESGSHGYNMFTNDGATIFSRNGRELRESFGAWNPNYFPGVTARLVKELRPSNDWSGYCSRSDFAGGVTDKVTDFAAGFIFDKYFATWKYSAAQRSAKSSPNPQLMGVAARKSYFKFGDTFLMLGCDIVDSMPENGGNLITTVEQVVKANDFAVLNPEKTMFRNNGFIYRILTDHTTGKINYVTEKRPLSWEKMHRQNKKIDGSQEMFQLWLDHGVNPQKGTYAYIVEVGSTPSDKLPQIMMNTAICQAALSPDGRRMGIIFYDHNISVKSPWGEVTVSAPAAVLLQQQGDKLRLCISDPQMRSKLTALELTVGTKKVTVKMPSGDLLGSAVNVIF